MGSIIKKENLTISLGEYQKDGVTKQRYKTIGELVTMQGDDGSVYQFGELWGPTGSTKFNVYSQDNNTQQPQQQNQGQQQNYQQQPVQQQQQQGYQQNQPNQYEPQR